MWKFSAVPTFVTTVLLSSALNPFAHAADDTYSFGGSCPSQGAWTQAALAETKNIVSIITKLENNEDCRGIGQLAQNFQAADSVLALGGAEKGESLVESLPSEISALRSTLLSSGGMNNIVRELLFKKTIQAAGIGGAAAATGAEPVMNSTTAIQALYTRTSRATKYGLNAAEQVFNQLPQYKKCLIGHPDEGMLLMSAAVKMGAAFASSDGGGAQQLGSSLASLTNMLRENNFTKAIRKGKETEFWFSVSCLMESVTKNYCEAQNAQDLMRYAQKEYLRSRGTKTLGTVDPNVDNPLEGYYLLVREIPMVAQWLRSVKQGTDPRRPSDAAAQNEDNARVQQMREMDKNIRSYLFQEMEVMRTQPTDFGKKNKLYNILMELVSRMTSYKTAKAAEFFTNMMNAELIPFYLIGLEEIPAACRAQDGKFVQEWNVWMSTSNDGKYVSAFDNPLELAKIIENRMNILIDGANANAAIFFRQRLVIDLLNLVNQTLVGQNITVRQSLQHMDRFLVRFESRLTDSYSDSIMRPSVYDTRLRIGRILQAYDGLAQIGHSLKGKSIDFYDEEAFAATRDAAKKMIDTVFAEVEVLYQNDVFLTNRFTTFIQRDFALRIRQGQNMTPYQQQLMKVTQDQLIARISLTFGSNPTVAKNDLAGAYLANSSNLGMLEETFSDTIFVMLEELNEVVNGRTADSASLNKLADGRYQRDLFLKQMQTPIGALGQITGNPLYRFISWLKARMELKSTSNDLYYREKNSKQVSRTESKFGDIAQLRGRLCGQTLAFSNRARFIPLCKGAVMKSAFSGDNEHSYLDLTYDDYTSTQYDPQINKDPVKLHKRVCAVNDYSIRNWVRMLEDRDQSNDGVEDEIHVVKERAELLPDSAALFPDEPAEPSKMVSTAGTTRERTPEEVETLRARVADRAKARAASAASGLNP